VDEFDVSGGVGRAETANGASGERPSGENAQPSACFATACYRRGGMRDTVTLLLAAVSVGLRSPGFKKIRAFP
jgi:hypothetical protein